MAVRSLGQSVESRQDTPSGDLVAFSPGMLSALKLVHAFAPAIVPVILYGETGSGKTLLAEYIHRLSAREDGFHVFSVGIMTPQLALDELFGHVRGAFTDAHDTRAGRIATAGSGTLLLDDLQNLDLSVQVQLLQVLDRGRYSPLGSERLVPVGCRVLFAMSGHPDELMRRGRLEPDLRYRFGECAVAVPPLRERRDEISVLAHRFLASCERDTGVRGPTRLSDDVLRALEGGTYPGNVRQLRGVMARAYLVAAAAGARAVRLEHLPEEWWPLEYRRGAAAENRAAAERALKEAGGNIRQAARLLGVSRNTFKMVMAKE